MQMHRAWVFAWDHNVRREYRVKRPEEGVHVEQIGVAKGVLRRLREGFFSRRFRLRGCVVPESIGRVWLNRVETPVLRWKRTQKGSSIRVPDYARRDLAQAYQPYQHAS